MLSYKTQYQVNVIGNKGIGCVSDRPDQGKGGSEKFHQLTYFRLAWANTSCMGVEKEVVKEE